MFQNTLLSTLNSKDTNLRAGTNFSAVMFNEDSVATSLHKNTNFCHLYLRVASVMTLGFVNQFRQPLKKGRNWKNDRSI